jgi:hypothetical protein
MMKTFDGLGLDATVKVMEAAEALGLFVAVDSHSLYVQGERVVSYSVLVMSEIPGEEQDDA